MSISLIIGILCAVWVYSDAKKHGYSQNLALLWALGTAALFWIVVPVYFLLGRRRKTLPQPVQPSDQVTLDSPENPVDVSEKVTCPMCASDVPSSFEKCPHCGFTLHLVCPNCGSELERTWKICPHCGAAAPEK